MALIERHYLWDETDSDTDAILFREGDFINPQNSKVFQKLRTLNSIKRYAESFENICKGSFKNVPSLETFIKENSTIRRHTSILVPIASAAIISVAGAYYYYSTSAKELKPLSVLSTIKTPQSTKPISIEQPPQNVYRYDIGEYDKIISGLRYSRELHPNDINITLSLVMLYAMSGFDDDKLYNLVLPLQQLDIQDERLYFALAIFSWRKGQINQASKFIDIIRRDLPQDVGLKRLVLSLDEIVQKNISSYKLYYNLINFDADDKALFAKSMLLLENIKLYTIMEKMYQESFIGFSSEHKFNANLSFKDWFDIYDAYNVAQGIKGLTALHKKFPQESRITYHLAINIAISYLEDNTVGCSFSSDKYANIADILGKEAIIISADRALDYANELLKTNFPKGYSYYALGMAHYAKSEFEQARKALLISAENYVSEDINAKIEEQLKNIKKAKECRSAVVDFQTN
jgi:tetratricopeptide (TPR) repeat protein